MSKTLSANAAANIYKTTNKPRVHIRITDIITDALILSFDTATKNAGTISRTIKPFGGIETVSRFTIEDLILADDFRLCTDATLTNTSEGARRGSGRIISQNMTDYDSARNAYVGSWATPTITVGQQLSASVGYGVYVGYFQATIPAMTTLEEATIYLKGLSDYSDTDFDIYLVEGNWTALSEENAMMNDYVGWAASGAYSLTQLNESYNSAEYVAYDATKDDNEAYNLFRLNAAGKAYVLSKAGSVAKFMFVSKEHADNSAPTQNEYVNFEASSAMLKLRYNTKTLDNQRAKVYRYYEPFTGTYADMQLLYSGVVDQHTLDNRTLALTIKKSDQKNNVLIPSKVIDEVTFTDCPEMNIGKAYPLVYGDFTTAAADLTHENGVGYFTGHSSSDFPSYQYGYNFNFIKALIVRKTVSMKALLSERPMKDSANPYYAWNGSRKRFELYPVAPTVDTPSVTEVIETIASANSSHPGSAIPATLNYASVQTLIPAYHGTYGAGVVFPERSYDTDPTNYATMTDELDAIYYYFNDEPSVSISDRFFVLAFITLFAGAEAEIKWQYLAVDEDENETWIDWTVKPISVDVTALHNSNTQIFARVYATPTLTTTISNFSKLRLVIYKTIADGYMRVYNVGVVTAYGGSDVTELATSGTGVPDDVSGTITGSASALIENPSHVIESIARNSMSQTAAEIDTSALDTIATSLTNWKFAFQLLEQKKAADLLDRMGEQCKTAVFRDDDDKLSAVMWNDLAYFSVSGTDIPSAWDIYASEGRPTITAGIESWTRHPILHDSLVIEQVNASEVYNSFTLRYRKNYASGEYMEVITIDNGLGDVDDISTTLVAGDEAYMENSQTITGLKTLTAASYTAMGNATNTLTYEAEFIRDRATAVKLLQHLVEVYTVRRYTVRFDTKETALALEQGEIINVRHRRVYDLFGTVTSDRKKWHVYDISHNVKRAVITIKAIEVTHGS